MNADPGFRIGIPVSRLFVGEAARCCAKGRCPLGVLDGAKHGSADEGRALPRPGEAVDLPHNVVVELYVHSHVKTVAPEPRGDRSQRKVGCLPRLPTNDSRYAVEPASSCAALVSARRWVSSSWSAD